MKFKKIIIFANSFDNRSWTGNTLSGGDEILINYIKFLQKKEIDIEIHTWKKGIKILSDNNINKNSIKAYNSYYFDKLGFTIFYLYRLIRIIIISLKIKKDIQNDKQTIVFSYSDFLTDVLPAYILKYKNNLKMITALYLLAPNPFDKYNPYKKFSKIYGFLYWLIQKISIKIILKNSNGVVACSELVIEYLKNRNIKTDNFLIIHGGINLTDLNNTKKKLGISKKIYDGCFFGRLHPQKGAVQIVEIWKKVVKIKPNAKLVIIGNGTEEKKVKDLIINYNLSRNIELKGFLFGEIKNKILLSSKIMVHPAIYDTGGMAVCQGMSYAIPAISFDLEGLKYTYPKGMVKIDCFNFELFANEIINLLDDNKYYNKYSNEAKLLAKSWGWDKRGEEFYNFSNKII